MCLEMMQHTSLIRLSVSKQASLQSMKSQRGACWRLLKRPQS